MIIAGDLKLDREGRRVFIGEKEINLTAKEFDLLELLVCNPNKVYSRESLLSFVWGTRLRNLDMYVPWCSRKTSAMRKSSRVQVNPKYVHTKWGVGYYFRA